MDSEDQQAINKFNRLFNRSGEIEAELKAKKVKVTRLCSSSGSCLQIMRGLLYEAVDVCADSCG